MGDALWAITAGCMACMLGWIVADPLAKRVNAAVRRALRRARF
jgi:hypothetical protein